MTKHIVKARKKTKNKFLDLTLPVEIRKKYGINHSDLFKIDVIYPMFVFLCVFLFVIFYGFD